MFEQYDELENQIDALKAETAAKVRELEKQQDDILREIAKSKGLVAGVIFSVKEKNSRYGGSCFEGKRLKMIDDLNFGILTKSGAISNQIHARKLNRARLENWEFINE